MQKITISTLDQMKARGEKIVTLTSYDASFARLSEQAGVDVLLVGDSLGNVIQGRDSTLPVTVEEKRKPRSSIVRRIPRTMWGLAQLRLILWKEGNAGS